jgi:uncharacterized phage-associated protein
MASVFDVAKYILENHGEMTTMKLQKLVYYSQSWSLVWDETPLFSEEIEAWANGPVSPDLYNIHRGQFSLSTIEVGNSNNLTQSQRETIDVIISSYGEKSSQWLSDRTHSETPWIHAREMSEAKDGERCNEIITHASMSEYYSSL